MSKKLIVYIGRFQLPHVGHQNIFKIGLELAKEIDGEFLCIIGSCDKPRTHNNPFTFEERRDMISIMTGNANIHFAKSVDYFHDQDWVESISDIVSSKYEEFFGSESEQDIVFLGHKKDDSEWYINLIEKEFPGCFKDCGEQAAFGSILGRIPNSTVLRNIFFDEFECIYRSSKEGSTFRSCVPVINYLKNWKEQNIEIFKQLCEEKYYYENYEKNWTGPYPVQFLAADAIIMNEDKVLLGIRKKIPGKGLFAIPGGFVERNETFLEAAKRELKEETCLELRKEADYRSDLFDKPYRSMRGRVVSRAYLFNSNDLINTVDDAIASDDLAGLKWVSVSDLKNYRSKLFEDHYFILTEMLGIKP